MKSMLIVLAIVSAATAAPQGTPDHHVPQIIRSEFETQPEGGYVFSFETEDGIQQQQNGEVKEALDEENKPHTVVVVRGSYTYTDPEGKQQTITYFADETGFHPEGESIPKEESRRR